MAIGTITVTGDLHRSAKAPLGALHLSFDADDDYATGGTTGFEATVQAAVGRTVDILCVVPVGLNGGYGVIYDKTNDKLVMTYENLDTGTDGPSIEVAETDYSGVTLKLLVLYQ